jgi:hypothetical protein
MASQRDLESMSLRPTEPKSGSKLALRQRIVEYSYVIERGFTATGRLKQHELNVRRDHMPLLRRKNILNCSKNLTKKLTYMSTLYVCTPSFVEN